MSFYVAITNDEASKFYSDFTIIKHHQIEMTLNELRFCLNLAGAYIGAGAWPWGGLRQIAQPKFEL